MHTFFIAPTGFGTGLTSISLGLLHALEHARLKVGLFKPVTQLYPGDLSPERSNELVAHVHGLDTPKPLPLAQVEWMLGNGQLDGLLEKIISLYQRATTDKDVVIVGDMVPTRHTNYTARVNFHLTKSLGAEVILVSVSESKMLTELTDRIEIQAQLSGGPHDPKMLGVIPNEVRGEIDTANAEGGVADLVRYLTEHLPLLRDNFRLIGCIPWQDELNVTCTHDIADLLGARVISAGDYGQHRVQKIMLCARAVPNIAQLFKPSVLMVIPGDRDNIIPAASLAAMNGVPLAGLLLYSDSPPDSRVMELCHSALQGGLPVLSVVTGSHDITTNLNRMSKETPMGDHKRVERVTEFITGYVDFRWLKQRYGTPHELCLSPLALRYQAAQHVQKAGKHIVLPEGSEPCIVQAAATCQARGIACCVLLTKPDEVQAVTRTQGIVLPGGLRVIDPDLARQRYVGLMVELCKSEEPSASMAE